MGPRAKPPGYALLDAGDGRRLERFGHRVVDRPAPGAVQPRGAPHLWTRTNLRYDRATGWSGAAAAAPWMAEIGGLTLELRATDAGQVGFFPEHAVHWDWLRQQAGDTDVLHLFSYTGASTLVLAHAGARVAHVDASRPTVVWARRNAELSGLADAPIRWLVDDAARFVGREVRRGRRYGGVVLDPPSYGHGASGAAWRLDVDLEPLLEALPALGPRFVLLTAHTPGWDDERLAAVLVRSLTAEAIESGRHEVVAESGASLVLGAFARGMIRG